MVTTKEREMLLAFLSKHADGDVLIQAANRVTNNITDLETLRKFMIEYKGTLHAEDFVGTKRTDIDTESPFKIVEDTVAKEFDKPEDLGPVPKKLGRVGKDAIEWLKKKGVSHSLSAISISVKHSESKLKPQLALAVHRGLISYADGEFKAT